MPVETPAEPEPTIEKVTRKVTIDKKQARRNRTILESLPILRRDGIDVEGIDLTRCKRIGEELTEVGEFEYAMEQATAYISNWWNCCHTDGDCKMQPRQKQKIQQISSNDYNR
ncbi:MAG: hypothetical protein ACI353_02900 [Alloprevotella sp.]